MATRAVLAAVALGLATTVAMPTAQAAPAGQANGPGRLYGDPTAAAPYWRYQTYDDCVLMAAADVVGQVTGHEPSEQDIIRVAQSTPSTVHAGPIYTKPANTRRPGAGKGASFADEPALLAHYGVHAVTTDKQSMDTLERDLAAGRKVIAGVNAELIWGEPQRGRPEADHALVVTGIDTAAGIVHLNDSGTEKGRDEKVPIGVFVRSWASSGNQISVTR